MPTFTDEQIENYYIYERIRESGMLNMFDPRARAISGLTKAEYLFVMDNYTALQEATK